MSYSSLIELWKQMNQPKYGEQRKCPNCSIGWQTWNGYYWSCNNPDC